MWLRKAEQGKDSISWRSERTRERKLDASDENGNSLATSVLLDRRMALVALLGVGTDPVRGLAVVGALLPPELGDLADDGSMISGFSTSERTTKRKGR